MRKLVLATVLAATQFPHVATPKEAYASDEAFTELYGELPRSGSLQDVLLCAGANEVLWTTAMKVDPRDFDAHEAKRKAGWYSAVALWIFAAESKVVLKAVQEAYDRKPQSSVFADARRCRKAPDSWRE